jgi:GNAT superfamily N-acetyltransferase
VTTGPTLRTATPADLPAIGALIDLAIDRLVGAVLDPTATAASRDFMGLDSTLVTDGTYFVIEDAGRIVACGGWSRRASMFGGDDADGRDPRLLDPRTEPARIRAMYTHPDATRRGHARRILAACEAAAAAAGFAAVELLATVPGEPLYVATGYTLVRRVTVATRAGIDVPAARMIKRLAPAP